MRTDRIAQLLSKYIAVGLFALVGYFTKEISEDQKAQITEIAGVIAGALIAFGMLGFDLLVHRKNNGGVLDAPKDKGLTSPKEAKSS